MNKLMKKITAVGAVLILIAVVLCGCAAAVSEDAGKETGSAAVQAAREQASQAESGDTGKEQDSRKAERDSIGEEQDSRKADRDGAVEEDGWYTSAGEVALYIHTYGCLPENYITKKEAEKLGWESSEGNLAEAAPGKSIGGGRFGNYEGALPDKKGRKWYECDINYTEGYRGAERIIYSSDGLIYYTGDHYKTFEQLY